MVFELMELTVCHMYPDLLNLYGDIGNIITLKKRCEWRGIKVNIVNFTVERDVNIEGVDIFFMGGGSDKGQAIVYSDLTHLQNILSNAIEEYSVFLAICGGYQLLGESYIDAMGNRIPGLGVLDYKTESEEGRLIGNVIIKNHLKLKPDTVVGFENHGGRTYHDYDTLGTILIGNGNNGKDSYEGMVYKNCIGTYLHGPVLPKNPHLTDHIILSALKQKYDIKKLEQINDKLEYKAHNKVLDLYGI